MASMIGKLGVAAALAATPLAGAGAHIFGDQRSLPAYLFNTTPVFSPGQGSYGFTFTLTKDTRVTGLGYWDQGGDGFVTPHAVGIFLDMFWSGQPGDLIASTVLPAGRPGELVDAYPYGSPYMQPSGFRFQKIKSIYLVGGLYNHYTIAGYSPSVDAGANDPIVYGGPAETSGFGPIGLSFNPRPPPVQLDANAGLSIDGGDGLSGPTNPAGDYQFYGVNFAGWAAPEPSAWTMMLIGLAAIGGLARRARRSAYSGDSRRASRYQASCSLVASSLPSRRQ